MTTQEKGTTRRNAPGRDSLTVFVHIPKTAGTTLTAVLEDNFVKGAGGVSIDKLSRLRESEALKALVESGGPRVLRGHLPFAVRDLLPSDTPDETGG